MDNPKLIVPDVNPAERALQRMQVAALHIAPAAPALKAPTRETDLDTRLSYLEDTVFGVIASLNGATITAVCNGDGTITVTLILPNLPG